MDIRYNMKKKYEYSSRKYMADYDMLLITTNEFCNFL